MKIHWCLLFWVLPRVAMCQIDLAYSEVTPYLRDIHELMAVPEESAHKLTAGRQGYFYNPLTRQLDFTHLTQSGMIVKGSLFYEEASDKKITVTWYSEKVKAVEGQCENGVPVGTWKFYNEREALVKSIQFKESEALPMMTEHYHVDFQVVSGDTIIRQGSGQYTTYYPDSTRHSTGTLRDGVKEGEWIGWYPNGNYMYVERYESGELLGGESYGEYGIRQSYDSLVSVSAPTVGMEQYYREIEQQMRYPIKARKKGVQGTVYIQITINKDGSVSDLKVLQGIGYGCDEEAVRAVKNGPSWAPAKIRGQPLRFRFVLPVTFSLDS